MKFYQFFEELLTEMPAGRPLGEEKYNFIIKNVGGFIFDEVVYSPKDIQKWDKWSDFKEYLVRTTNNKFFTTNDVVENLDSIGDWLVTFSESEFKNILNSIYKAFPNIKVKVDNYKKPMRNPLIGSDDRPRRGRPPGTGKKQSQDQKPKITFSREIGRRPLDPQSQGYEEIGLDDIGYGYEGDVASSEPKKTSKPTLYLGPEDSLRKRGRKPIDDGLTAIERAKYKSEGVKKISDLEGLVEKLYKEEHENYRRYMDKIKKVTFDIIKRKKFFNLEISDEEELFLKKYKESN